MEHTAALDLPAETATATPSKPVISEDWLAVCIGSLLVLLVLAGVRPATARFAWANAADLATVFSADNLARSLQLGILLMVPAAGGALLL